MKLKDGKYLSHLEIIKRLNLMGIGYDSDIIGKNYYIELYNKAIKTPLNREKIKSEIKKDEIYMNFYNQKLRKRNECSFEINNISYNNKIDNNYKYNFHENNNSKKIPFSGEFNGALMNNILFSHLCYTTYDYAKNNKNKIGKILNKVSIPINAIKKYSMINIYPEIKIGIKKIINIIDNNLIGDKYNYIIYFSFIILIITVIHFIKKKYNKYKYK